MGAGLVSGATSGTVQFLVWALADCVSDRVGFAIPQPTEWQRSGNQIDAAFIFARADFVKRVAANTDPKPTAPSPVRKYMADYAVWETLPSGLKPRPKLVTDIEKLKRDGFHCRNTNSTPVAGRGNDTLTQPDFRPSVVCGMASPNAVANAIGYAEHYSRSHDAVIRVYDDAGNVIETHEPKGDFKEW